MIERTRIRVGANVDGLWHFQLADVTLACDLMDCRNIIVRSDLIGEAADIIKQGLAEPRTSFLNLEITVERIEGEESHATE